MSRLHPKRRWQPAVDRPALFGVANHSGHMVLTTFDEPAAMRKASAFHGVVVTMPLWADFRLLPAATRPATPDAAPRRTALCHCLRPIWWSETASGFAGWVHLQGGSPICTNGQNAAPADVIEVRP